jgi:hypothetical protein
MPGRKIPEMVQCFQIDSGQFQLSNGQFHLSNGEFHLSNELRICEGFDRHLLSEESGQPFEVLPIR